MSILDKPKTLLDIALENANIEFKQLIDTLELGLRQAKSVQFEDTRSEPHYWPQVGEYPIQQRMEDRRFDNKVPADFDCNNPHRDPHK